MLEGENILKILQVNILYFKSKHISCYLEEYKFSCNLNAVPLFSDGGIIFSAIRINLKNVFHFFYFLFLREYQNFRSTYEYVLMSRSILLF